MQTQQQQEKKNQIIRKDAKGVLMEVNTQSFSIGKVQFVFSKYDENRPKGQRTTDRVPVYMDFPAALEFAQSVLDGRLSKELVAAQKKFAESNKPWDKDVVISMGGTAHPKNRTDGKAESRIMKAQLGTKNPIALFASIGPGYVNDKGLIVPEKGAPLEHSVMITMSAKDIREVALMIKVHVEAYLNTEHAFKVWSYVPVQSSNQGNGQPQSQSQDQRNNQPQQRNGNYGGSNNPNGYSQPSHSQNPTSQPGNYAIQDEELPF